MRRILSFFALLPCLAQATDLQSAYQHALKHDPVLMEAKAAWLAHEQELEMSSGALMPQVDLTAGQERTELNSQTNPLHESHYTVSLRQPLFDWQALQGLKQARLSTQAAHAAYSDARQQVILRVSQAYMNVLNALEKKQLLEQSTKTLKQTYATSQQRVQVGLETLATAKEAKAQLDATQAALIAANNQVSHSVEALSELTGEHYKQFKGLGHWLALKKPKPEKIAAWVGQAEKNNYALKARRLYARVAKEQQRQLEHSHYPQVSAISSLRGSHGDNLVTGSVGSDKQVTFGVVVSMPVYHGGTLSAQAKQARFQAEQALYQAQSAHQALITQTRDHYLAVMAAIAQAKAQKQAIDSGQAALEAIQAGYKVGNRTLVDVLKAQSELASRKLAYTQARTAYLLSMLQLKQAAARLSPKDIQGINHFLVRSIDVKSILKS